MSSLFLVHAHPDDEAISTGGAMMKARADGHRVVLVTATRGEAGEIHNMDPESTRPHLAEVRTKELEKASRLLGVNRGEFLGYRDSGMVGTADNDNPKSFHQAPLGEAAARLATILREEKPEVVVT
jgi:LmbE family N-acetylglucosaminyl deacetylase